MLLLVAFFTFMQVMAQPNIELPQKYIQREINAPANMKNLLSTQRAQIIQQKLEFNVGFTGVSLKSIPQITGEKEVNDGEVTRIKQLVKARSLTPGAIEAIKIYLVDCFATKSSYDARAQNYVTPVRDQQCGNCWSYSAAGAYEGSYLRVNGATAANVSGVNTSEQYIVNCSGGGDCGPAGGLAYKVFEWMVDNNKRLERESVMPDLGVVGACGGAAPVTNYYATDWGCSFFNWRYPQNCFCS